mmetsp:Transcript_16040/g.22296  ORF Transcript_16040/g.22296 Transcript_16040/m.22296 type:complete len:294 (+) Transcript_16040:226-1107(+)|eukprot:CAMPEP_0168564504 /NCGR_PEP_ID=MMETSP0413-20121227/13287_1 /TAXON_ID=136452 /ORGANISM="Filamoeba nolandi, Strain NC-AS-23-1" /LENGTH=293 /DNA_ID=CAMNT_0008596193 /DNA_START=149 /DNA_END=1030 /DNA_ORIENTATION=+
MAAFQPSPTLNHPISTANSNPPSSTLFIADLPPDFEENDLVSLFMSLEGYQSSRIRKDKKNNSVGFVEFLDAHTASMARDALQGYKTSFNDKGFSIQFSQNKPKKKSRDDGSRNNFSNNNGKGRYNNNTTTSSQPNPTFGSNNNTKPSMIPELSPFYSGLPSFAQLSYPSPLSNNILANLINIPNDASSTLYVEGLPSDASEREVAHIFRQWPGYQSLRILVKESKQFPSRTHHLCFVEFDNKLQATLAMNHLQGYRFDPKVDSKGLSVSYARTERKEKRKPHLNNDGNNGAL